MHIILILYNYIDSSVCSGDTSDLCCSCCNANTDGTVQGCSTDLQCQIAVCNDDSFCCNNYWDGICANDAKNRCLYPTTTTTGSISTSTTTINATSTTS